MIVSNTLQLYNIIILNLTIAFPSEVMTYASQTNIPKFIDYVLAGIISSNVANLLEIIKCSERMMWIMINILSVGCVALCGE